MIALAAAVAFSACLKNLPSGMIQDAIPTGSYISVPLESGRVYNYLWVACEVDGRPVKLLLDTGAAQSYILSKLAARLGLQLGPTQRTLSIDGREVECQSGVVGLKVGAVACKRLPVGVLDMTVILEASAPGVGLAGVLGADFLKTYGAIIDYRNKRLHLRDYPAEDRACLQGRWQATGIVNKGLVRDNDDHIKERYLKKSTMSVAENRFEFRFGDRVWSGTFITDPSERPRQLKLSTLAVNGQHRPDGHIFYYDVQSDRLRLLMNLTNETPTKPPTALKSTAENKHSLWTFERMKPEQAPPPRLKVVRPR